MVDWTSLVDPARLAAWMDAQGLGDGGISDVVPLTGGTQNVLLRFRKGAAEYVLRRPPAHPQANGNATMLREARLLGALRDTAVPHPGLIGVCADESVLGAAFFLMQPVEGFNAHAGLPAPHRDRPDWRRRMAFSLIDALLALGAVDHVAVGLADFGKPDGYLERQVTRWRTQLEGYRQYDGWPGSAALGDAEEIADWLSANVPTDFRPGIMHGDVHLANMMFRFDAPEVAALVDWELATIGDPLIDLGWLLSHWPDRNGEGRATTGARPWDGFPDADALVDYYGQRSARNVAAIDWYAVLACYKRGAIIEGTYARACAGKADRATGERLHNNAIALFDRARQRISTRPPA